MTPKEALAAAKKAKKLQEVEDAKLKAAEDEEEEEDDDEEEEEEDEEEEDEEEEEAAASMAAAGPSVDVDPSPLPALIPAIIRPKRFVAFTVAMAFLRRRLANIFLRRSRVPVSA